MTDLHQHEVMGNGARPVRNKPPDGYDDPDDPAVMARQQADIDEANGKSGKVSVATLLVGIAEGLYRFGVSDTGQTFAVPRTGPKVVAMLRGGKLSLRAQLAREFFRLHGKAAPQQALADALLVIEGVAQEAEPEELHLRVARRDGHQWLDLGDATGAAVRITPNGWTVEHEVPVLFMRTPLNSALPTPERGGSLDELWELLNLEPDDRPLLASWLVAGLVPDIPHPALGLSGEQGTGKSTVSKFVVSALDPSPVPVRKPPKDAESWVTAAAGSWVVGLDNLSEVQPWMSDSICRACTGDGDVRRKLYTDGDLAVFRFRRLVLLNGIDFGAMRGDLADRLMPFTLPRVSDRQRLDEEELWPLWHQRHPRILGALLDLAASVAGVLPSVRLESKPRMADFARIVAAVDVVLGTDALSTYLGKQAALATDSLTGDDFVVAMASAIGRDFVGTSAALLRAVEAHMEAREHGSWRIPKGWPRNARSLTTRLNRQAPVMRKAGWTVEHDNGANHENAVRWTIRPPEKAGISGSQHSHDSQNSAGASHASQASHESGPLSYGITGTCRICQTDSTTADDLGPVHPLCLQGQL